MKGSEVKNEGEKENPMLNLSSKPLKMFKLDTAKVDNWSTLQKVLEGLNLHMDANQYDGASPELQELFVEVVDENDSEENQS